jgi:hypothetical protein
MFPKRRAIGAAVIVLGLLCFGGTNKVATSESEDLILLRIGGISSQQTEKPNMCAYTTASSLAFTPNRGQWDEQVLYRADAGGAVMWFTADGAYYHFTRSIPKTPAPADPRYGLPVGHELSDEPDSLEVLLIKSTFVGSNPNPEVSAANPLNYTYNYFLGNDRSHWKTHVPNYTSIRFAELYPGIDLQYYGNGSEMEYDFLVSPGADPASILIRYDGAKSLSVNESGELEVGTQWGKVIERRPIVYQTRNDKQIALDGIYSIRDKNSFGFELDQNYDPALPVVIDPVLSYSTFLGGASRDDAKAIAVDSAGHAYVVGYTTSANFPTVNAYDDSLNATYSAPDVFITKLSADGGSLVFSTFVGGSFHDWGRGIAVNAQGESYVTGTTRSSNFPQVGGQGRLGGDDAFILKLAALGDNLIYCTFVGGSKTDNGWAIAVDKEGCAYVAGNTNSIDFMTVNAYCDHHSGQGDAFMTKVSPDGENLIFSTYLGGSNNERGTGIAVDHNNSPYIAGNTMSPDLPMVNAFDSSYGSGGASGTNDVFVAKFTPQGDQLAYSTYLGGDQDEWWVGIAVDSSGSAYIGGFTYGEFPTVNAIDSVFSGRVDAFVTKLTPAGNDLVYSTYYGGLGGEVCYGIAVDRNGNAYISGQTGSADIPVVNADGFEQDFHGLYFELYVAKFAPSGDALKFSTHFGSWGGGEDVYGIAVDDHQAVYLTGNCSGDFPTKNAFDSTYGGTFDGFVAKIDTWTCDCPHQGDANGDETFGVVDLIYLINYALRGGPDPVSDSDCPAINRGDWDCSGNINLVDIVHMVSYIFRFPAPGPCNPCA